MDQYGGHQGIKFPSIPHIRGVFSKRDLCLTITYELEISMRDK